MQCLSQITPVVVGISKITKMLKASEALQVRVQFDQVGGQIGRMEEMAERYQEAQRTIGDQQRVIG